jgi:imidazole glycerol-phosphate synthase subunit HisF
MLRPRIIPCLLIHQGGLVKTQNFINPKYVGDPVNTVRIFNDKEADELMIFDIDATVKNMAPNFNLIAKLAMECRMPLCYGGGITTAEQAVRIVEMGVEKVAISAAAISNPSLLTKISAAVGRQSVVAVIDVRQSSGGFSKGYDVFTHNGKVQHKIEPIQLAKQLQFAGAGEIVINSIDRDGLMQGYDLELADHFNQELKIPMSFLGGAGKLDHLSELISKLGLVGAAAGSIFVFKGKYRAVLINYPTPEKKIEIFRESVKW